MQKTKLTINFALRNGIAFHPDEPRIRQKRLMTVLRHITSAVSLILALTVSIPVAYAQMTDEQAINYIQQQSKKGKSEQQIGQELLSKGVTPDQAKRLKSKYSPADGSHEAARTARDTKPVTRTASSTAAPDMFGELGDNVVESASESGKRIFGHNVFSNRGLTFEPNVNQATPQNYRLGPGDEVVIDIWGASEDHIRQVISPEGSITVQQIGPIYLNGMTINEANTRIKDLFSNKYAGIQDEEAEVNITLGQMRTIQVNLMGEVSVPGTYRLSPFATVFHALYRAGGINRIGSMRDVQVMRNGRRIAQIDIYEYLFGGKDADNVRLEEGDVIIVPPYKTLVNIEGNVKRPMLYEITDKESLSDLLKYSGGFTGDAYSDMVRLSRQTGHENELYNIKSDDFASYKLKDGDVITVGTIVDRYANRVQLRGQVLRPGTYALGEGVETVTQLINKAEGLLENAYTDRVLIYREGPDLTLQVLPIDLGAIMSGTAPDIRLQRNDVIEIANLQELLDRGGFTIQGEVASPGTFPYAENTTVEDLILQAGGLLQGASTARIEVSRRIVDPSSLHTTNQIAETFTLTYTSGRVGDESSKFTLQPYDIVQVRKSPVYMAQQRVAIGGEVAFGGAYTIIKRNERISNLIQRAGGLTEAAYIRGAHLSRRMTEDEITARNEALRLAYTMQDGERSDSISIMKMELRNRYNVAIELDKALANPGGDEDLVLTDGDVLFIPQLINTVKIQGEVMYPNTVVFQKGKKLKHYIDQAGGYGSKAKKSKAYVVYLNGTVARAKNSTPIEPGCQIIVPSKAPRKGVDWNAVLSIGTSAGALGTMAASIAALLR